MSVVTLTQESHKNPDPFRVKYEDANLVLGPKPKIPINDELPVIETSSKVAIIGAGFGGMTVAHSCLTKLNIDDFVMFDKHDNFGGTWYVNTYPGCACDIPALWYSFSFELNNNWSRIQPPQFEMEEYILKVAEKYNLQKYAKFKTAVTRLEYNDEAANWTMYIRDLTNGQLIKHTAEIVTSCQGSLVNPIHYNAKGLEDFQGVYMHSAVYNHDVSLEGKNIAVIGNGCSANQLVPNILSNYKPKSVTQIFKSKHYIMPPVPRALQWLYRFLSFSFLGLTLVRLLTIAIAEARFPLYKGNGIFSNIVRRINTRSSRNYIQKQAPKKYHDLLTPDFKIGCKRMIYDYQYVPSLHDERVTITDDAVDHITKDSIVFKNGKEKKVDIIIACTGYDVNKSYQNYEIIGRKEKDVGKIWANDGGSAYQTVLLRDAPNLFFIAGPNSATGHSSVVMAIENGCTYFEKLIKPVLAGKYKSVCVKTEKYKQWYVDTQNELHNSVFGTAFGGCVSWYGDGHVNSSTYPYSQIRFWWEMTHPRYKDIDYEPLDNK
ncbi:uncharacterized protein RJT21DRAFT_122419 [Scheffersomyces amazonensis]|uniref:uncharacterized protein n=1 Tax=Scheffersomyces amazonensis TaxID=1078765 RepID=UPI00315CB350